MIQTVFAIRICARKQARLRQGESRNRYASRFYNGRGTPPGQWVGPVPVPNYGVGRFAVFQRDRVR